jgi:lipopolysaccharide/colanic/teichoic acid biosynthesis glycosyltransferase
MLVVAAAVKLTSAGPAIYRGKRAGVGGRPFDQFKFRSMHVALGGSGFTKSGDARITKVGRVIRLLKVDELPQLFNVLRGEMSIVGPRPEDFAVVQDQYRGEQLRVLSARPGLTSIVEVRAFPDFSYYMPEGVDQDAYYREHFLPRRLRDDLEYIDRMSLGLDLSLIAQTVWCILFKGWWVILKRKTRRAPNSGGDERP